MEWWQSLITGLVIAGATSWATVQLALRRFYRERWWERRMDAYTKVIEALHNMKRDLTVNYRALTESHTLAKEFEERFAKRHSDAFDDIARLADVGVLLFSPQAVALLNTMLKETAEAGEIGDYFSYLDGSLPAVEKCLEQFREITRRDLGLPSTEDFRARTWE